MPAQHEQVRLLSTHDIPAIERLLHTSEYIYQRFTPEELPLLLRHAPAVGLFNGNSLHGFLLSQTLNPPSAWIGGFGVSWTESRAYLKILRTLLNHLSARLLTRGVRQLHYSGNDQDRDWLRSILLTQGFAPYRHLYAYDKFDFGIPTPGNQQVTLRPVRLFPPSPISPGLPRAALPRGDEAREEMRRADLRLGASEGQSDMAALLAMEEVCFEELWRYDSLAFTDIATTHPYFVVAELDGRVVGYQFNALDGDFGYLVRIAVHPAFSGQRIGARLMAEAVHFFREARVSRILLNTQDDNAHAHRLYEWFGFIRVQQMGFVLRKYLSA